MAHPLLSLILAGPGPFESASRRLVEAQRPAAAPAVAHALALLTTGAALFPPALAGLVVGTYFCGDVMGCGVRRSGIERNLELDNRRAFLANVQANPPPPVAVPQIGKPCHAPPKPGGPV